MRAPRPAGLFFLVTLFLSSWHLDQGHNDNTMARAASVASMVDRGTLEITPIQEVTGDKCLVNGRYFSDKAPLPSFVVLPFHWAAVKLGLVDPGAHDTLTDGLLRLGGFLCGSLPFALLITLAWKELRARRTALPLNAALLAALPLFGSFLFVYSGSFYNHLPGALFAVLAARCAAREQHLATGLWSGAAFLCDSVLLLLPALWTMQLLLDRRWRSAAWILAGLVPGLLGMAAHNLAVTGDALAFPNAYAVNYSAMHQRYGFGTWQPAAFTGMLFTDYRGLFFYMPFLVVGLWTLPRNMDGRTFLRDPFVLPAMLLIGVFLTHATWWGGWTYGPRYIMAAATLLFIAIVNRIQPGSFERKATLALSGFGVLCALAAKMTISYSMPTEVPHPLLTEVLPRLLKGEWTAWQWPVLLGLSPAASAALYMPTFAAGLYLLKRIDRSLPDHAPVPLPHATA